MLGFGLGGRGGIGLFGLYAGVEGMYYFGGSQDGVKAHSDLYGVDLGYNLKLPFVTIRPMLGIGNFTATGSFGGASVGIIGGTSVSVPAASDSKSSLYLQPGVTALVSLGLLYVGADVNALIITDAPQTSGNTGVDVALTVHGQVGVRF
jgi:hypothetical protein